MSQEDSDNCVGSINNGYSEQIALKVFKLIEAMAKYSFNVSHAGSYSVLTYKSAWLSLYYPHEFAIGSLQLLKEDKDRQAVINLCRAKGIKFLRPDINYSEFGFEIEYDENNNKCIRYGLSKIKNVGSAATEYLSFIRSKVGRFVSFDHFIEVKTDKNLLEEYNIITNNNKKSDPINKGIMERLILAGVFEDFEPNRFKLLNYYIDTYSDSKTKKEYIPYNEMEYNLVTKNALELFYYDEYVTGHPLDKYYCDNLSNIQDNQMVMLPAIITSKKVDTTRNGKDFMKIEFQSSNNSYYKANLFGNTFERFQDIIKASNTKKSYSTKKKSKKKESKEEDKKKETTLDQIQAIIKDEIKKSKCKYMIKGVYSKQYNNFNVVNIDKLDE